MVWVIISVMVIALVVLVGYIVITIANQSRTAQATALQYFEAIAAGDTQTIQELTEDSSRSHPAAAFAEDALDDSLERISDISVTQSQDITDTFNQKVDVDYTLDGKSYETTLVLGRGEPEWGFLNTWYIRQPYTEQVVFLMTGNSSFNIGEHTISADSPVNAFFPGVYPIEAAFPQYFDISPKQFTVDQDLLSLKVEFIPHDDLIEEVEKKVHTVIDECAADTDSSTPRQSCGLSTILPEPGRKWGSWEIVEYPKIKLTQGGSVYSTVEGLARFIPDDGTDPVDMYRPMEFTGFVSVSDDGVRIAPAR